MLVVLIGLLALAVGSDARAGRRADAPAPSRSAVITAARQVIDAARYATLVTLDGQGHPQARIVDPFVPDVDFTVWVATNARSRKVAEIARDRRITLTYFDRGGQHYVTVIGTAGLVRDPVEKAKRWKDEWATFYSNGPRGDDYVLIRIQPTRLEVVAPSLGMNNDPTTWRPVIIAMP